ncbi:hypothetical protein [Loigolactobacillus binensis]|uniref:Lipoprotein n=1 Tax=Loigolactobacillus binensis TaxID=2559922 RepID=A0ABW3E8A9_9LACO
MVELNRWILSGLLLVTLGSLGGCGQQQARKDRQSSAISASIAAKNAALKSQKVSRLEAENSSLKKAQQATKEASSSTATSTTTSREASNSANTNSAPAVVKLTNTQKEKINAAFLAWAIQQAKIGKMAVSDWYFDHGSAGHGDWFAQTPDGKVQVQDFGVPGEAAFPIHAIGGCVFYTAKDGTTGYDKLYTSSFATNYSTNMDFSAPVSKYLLGDNGVVYELKTGNGEPVSTTTGFGEYSNDGTTPETIRDSFSVSADQAAQAQLQKLLASYR